MVVPLVRCRDITVCALRRGGETSTRPVSPPVHQRSGVDHARPRKRVRAVARHRRADEAVLERLELLSGDAAATRGDRGHAPLELRHQDVAAADDGDRVGRDLIRVNDDLPRPLFADSVDGEERVDVPAQQRAGVWDGERGLRAPLVLPHLACLVGEPECAHAYSDAC